MNENFKKYEYIKKCNKQDSCLPNAWIVVRLDGRNFTRFTDIHNFVKPNDLRALELMNRAAAKVMEELEDICLAYGESDEYSFVFKKNTSIFNRDSYAINSAVNSLFTAAYVYYWNHFFAFKKLWCLPGFDGRVVIYPTDENLRDYLSWRQADTHINNLYNTVFWALVSKGNHDRRKVNKITLLSLHISLPNSRVDYRLKKFYEVPCPEKKTTFCSKITVLITTTNLNYFEKELP